MIRYRFGQDDVLRTRFAVSPLFEATASVAALRDPAGHSLHLPWIRDARERLGGTDHAMLDGLVSDRGRYTPDFIAPPPESPLPDVQAEIERVGRTPAAQVRREVGHLAEGGCLPDALRPLIDDPRRGLRLLVGQLRTYWTLAIEPVWERIRAVLEDDIAHRARLLTASGPIEVFGDLHPRGAGGRPPPPRAPAARRRPDGVLRRPAPGRRGGGGRVARRPPAGGRRRPRRPGPAARPAGVLRAAGRPPAGPAVAAGAH